jgi:hypothetical protein
LQAELDATMPELTAEVEATQAEYDSAIDAIKPALNCRNGARVRRSKANSQCQRKVDTINQQLSATCDPRIEAELEK